jgi:drug/metabolite transporter superfamily protein YnfA
MTAAQGCFNLWAWLNSEEQSEYSVSVCSSLSFQGLLCLTLACYYHGHHPRKTLKTEKPNVTQHNKL